MPRTRIASTAMPHRLGSIDNRHDRRCILPLPATEEVLEAPDPSGAAPAARVLQGQAARHRIATAVRRVNEIGQGFGTPTGNSVPLEPTRNRLGSERVLTILTLAWAEFGSALAEGSGSRSVDSAAAVHAQI